MVRQSGRAEEGREEEKEKMGKQSIMVSTVIHENKSYLFCNMLNYLSAKILIHSIYLLSE